MDGAEPTSELTADITTLSARERQLAPLDANRAEPFQPGQSGNPAGRPPDDVRLAKALAKRLGDRGGPEALANALLDVALDPEHRSVVAAIKETWDRLEGPVTQRQDLRVQADRTIIRSGSPAHPPALPGTPDPREIEATQIEQGRDEPT